MEIHKHLNLTRNWKKWPLLCPRLYLVRFLHQEAYTRASPCLCVCVLVLHCRCHKCSSVPARKRVRKQVSSLGLLSLPEEVLLCVLQWLSAEDLLAVRAVSPPVVPVYARDHTRGCSSIIVQLL